MRIALSLAAVTGLFLVGCNKSPEGGAPGTENKFTMTLPTTETNLRQGQKETVKISITRGKDFKQTVKLKVEPPADSKIKAELSKDAIAPADPTEVSVTLDVAKDAPLGHHMIKVTGTPDQGAATTGEFKVEVKAP